MDFTFYRFIFYLAWIFLSFSTYLSSCNQNLPPVPYPIPPRPYILGPSRGWGWKPSSSRPLPPPPSPNSKQLLKTIKTDSKIVFKHFFTFKKHAGVKLFGKFAKFGSKLINPFPLNRNLANPLHSLYHPVGTVKPWVKVPDLFGPNGGSGSGRKKKKRKHGPSCTQNNLICSIANNLGHVSKFSTEFGNGARLKEPQWYKYGPLGGVLNVNELIKHPHSDKGQNQEFENNHHQNEFQTGGHNNHGWSYGGTTSTSGEIFDLHNYIT